MKRSICPSCHKREGVRLLWGYPDDEAFELASRRETVLGGCIPDTVQLDRQCRSCGNRWDSSLMPQNEHQAQANKNTKAANPKKSTAQFDARARSRATRQDTLPVETATKTKAVTHTAPPKQKSISILPTLVVFVMAVLVSFTLVGAVVCTDGWASGSIGRAGGCSHHGGVNYLPRMLAFFFSVFVTVGFHVFRMSRANRR